MSISGGSYVISSLQFTSGANSTAETLALRATFRTDNIARQISGKQLVLETTDGGKQWACHGEAGPLGIAPRYLPAACK